MNIKKAITIYWVCPESLNSPILGNMKNYEMNDYEKLHKVSRCFYAPTESLSG